jgi:hypothetical protein
VSDSIGQDGILLGSLTWTPTRAEIHSASDIKFYVGPVPVLTVDAGGATTPGILAAAAVSAGAGTFGTLSAGVKAFDIPHPSKPDMRLRYACLEGPENGVYVRGETSLNMIHLPEEWRALVDPDSITVHLTPLGPWHVWPEVVTTGRIFVRTDAERPDARYSYLVMATRKDVPPLVTEYPSQEYGSA